MCKRVGIVERTFVVTRLVQAVSLGEGIVDIGLPVADGAAGVHARSALVDQAAVDGRGRGAGGKAEDEGNRLCYQPVSLASCVWTVGP